MYTTQQAIRAAKRILGYVCLDRMGRERQLNKEEFIELVRELVLDSWYWGQ